MLTGAECPQVHAGGQDQTSSKDVVHRDRAREMSD